jgi:hypothetical protein
MEKVFEFGDRIGGGNAAFRGGGLGRADRLKQFPLPQRKMRMARDPFGVGERRIGEPVCVLHGDLQFAQLFGRRFCPERIDLFVAAGSCRCDILAGDDPPLPFQRRKLARDRLGFVADAGELLGRLGALRFGRVDQPAVMGERRDIRQRHREKTGDILDRRVEARGRGGKIAFGTGDAHLQGLDAGELADVGTQHGELFRPRFRVDQAAIRPVVSEPPQDILGVVDLLAKLLQAAVELAALLDKLAEAHEIGVSAGWAR